ncbi:thiamine phosphate synthase [Spirosoma endbachense]|uniref:Thiamine-phosphate synthase n=1 Tax=Spirosoma endbachense TaxID=2666025 RepID=A0A6P1VZH8_9BACT|nr:thiamine phosphate synthase [Spirosoma endbachense]QHV98195.1 thiamine phosphate synthase [Spirosoma endbachense]
MSGLYLVTDSEVAQSAGHTLPFVVEEACRAGVKWVQLREKALSTRAFVALGVELKRITQAHSARLIVNDRTDVALAIDADGVHVGQDDMPYPLVRSLIGPDKIIGLSINNLSELPAAAGKDLDYFGIATIFPTGTKQDTSSLLGLEGLRAICNQTSLPTFAIGGIKASNIQDVIRAGASGVAVVSAICGHPSPYEATRELIQLIGT